MIPIIGFVGYSNSGKTMVVSTLVRILSERGYRVAAIKHAAHGYDIDSPGKDSRQHFDAGAQKVIVVGNTSFTIHERCQEPPSLNEITKNIDNVDFIIVEGFKSEPGPKIEIIRREYNSGRIPLGDELLAVVSDMQIEKRVPSFAFEELEFLADFLIKYFQS